MELLALRCFVAVAEELHFRRAALRLHMSQPPLSAQIQGLERELALRLFRRGPGTPVSLTPAGTTLLPLAREIVELAERARLEVDHVRRCDVGELRVAIAPEITGPRVARAILQFRAAFPNIDCRLREMDAPRQCAEMESGELDVAILHHILAFDDAMTTALDEAQLGVVMRRDDSLSDRSHVDPADLRDGRPIVIPGTLPPTCEHALIEHCRNLGIEPHERYGATGSDAFLEAVSAAFGRPGVALAPERVWGHGVSSMQLAWRPLAAPLPVLKTSALTDSSRESAAAANFRISLLEGEGIARASRSA